MNFGIPRLGYLSASIIAPIALFGLLVACVSIVYLASIRARRKSIDLLPGNIRVRALDEYLIRYKLNLGDAAPEVKAAFVMKEMQLEANRSQSLAALGAVVALASFAMLIFQTPSRTPSQVSDPNDRVLYYKGQILALRGDIEANSHILETDLRQRGLQLAELIGAIDEKQLRLPVKIVQHEYRGWAFLMGVSSYTEAPPDSIPAESRIDYATEAVAEFDAALGLMADMAHEFKDGVPTAIPIYEWMTGPSEDLNRTHYLKAIALAVIARAGAGTQQPTITELSEISPSYLARFPADNNPDLAWVLRHSTPRSFFSPNGGTDAPIK